MPLFKKKKKEPDPQPEPKERHLVKRTFSPEGMVYYQKNIMKLATPNPDYKKPIHDPKECIQVSKYNYRNQPLSLEDDPKYKGCIQIKVDGRKVGILNAEDSDEMKQILQKEIKYLKLYFRDGPYKEIDPDGNIREIDANVHGRLSVGYMEET